MKARLPIKYQSGKALKRYRAARLNFLIVAYVLWEEFGFGTERMNRVLMGCNALMSKIEKNPTWVDELDDWAAKRKIEW